MLLVAADRLTISPLFSFAIDDIRLLFSLQGFFMTTITMISRLVVFVLRAQKEFLLYLFCLTPLSPHHRCCRGSNYSILLYEFLARASRLVPSINTILVLAAFRADIFLHASMFVSLHSLQNA